MGKELAAIIFGLGVALIFFILDKQVETMPIKVVVPGYAVGGVLMIIGILGFFCKRKHEKQIDNIRQELERKHIAGYDSLKIFDALREHFALGLTYPQIHKILTGQLPKVVAWGVFSSDILATFEQLGLIHSTSIDSHYSTVLLDFKRTAPNYVYQLTGIGMLLAHKLMKRKPKIGKGGSQP